MSSSDSITLTHPEDWEPWLAQPSIQISQLLKRAFEET